MKFGRVVGVATSGIAQALGALAMGGRTQQQAYDGEMQGQSKLAQAMAQAQAQQAQARLYDAQEADTTAGTARAAARPNMVDLAMAASAGVDVPTLGAFRQKMTTGQAPQVPMGPPAEDGGMGLGAAQFPPEVSSKIGQALQRFLPVAMAEKDINPQQWAQALGAFRGMDLGDQVLGGQRTAADVGRAQAAVEAKPLYNSDASGAVLDLFGGALATDNPMAQGSIAVKRETAGAQKANAVQSYAAADSSRASAARTRAEMNDGANRSGGKAPVGYRWGADGQTLEAIPGGPADPNTKGAKLSKPPTEGQAKALMFGTRMAAADEVLAEVAKDGVLRPGAIKSAAEGVAGAVPIIGESLGNGAGFVTNWTQSAAQQAVEQAQRDFVNAVLRRESGAVIAPVEFANATRQYFPQPGDSPQVLRQKAANRKTAIAGMKAEFGEAMQPEFDRILGESRAARKAPAKPGAPAKNTGGASGGWGDEAAPGGQRVVRVPY